MTNEAHSKRQKDRSNSRRSTARSNKIRGMLLEYMLPAEGESDVPNKITMDLAEQIGEYNEVTRDTRSFIIRTADG